MANFRSENVRSVADPGDIQAPLSSAMKALVDSARIERLRRLREVMKAAERKNPYNSPVMAAPPTVTVSASADAALTQIYTFVSAGAIIAASTTSAADKVNWLGGIPLAYNSNLVTQVSSSFYPNLDGNMTWAAAQSGKDANLTADLNQVLGGFEFCTSAPTVELRLYLDTTLNVGFIVDGEFVSKSGSTATTGTTSRGDYYKLAFGSSAARRIRVLFTASPQTRSLADGNGGLQGWTGARSIAVTAGYTIWKPKDKPLRMGVFGDSYSTGVGGSNSTGTWKVPGQTYPSVMGDMLGVSDVHVFGVGSTGYLAAGNGGSALNRLNVVDLIPRLLTMYGGDLGLDLAVFGHGYNDRTVQTSNPTGLAANITAALGLVRAMDDTLPIFVLGAQAGATGPSQALLDTEALIKTAVEQLQTAGDNLIEFIPVSPDLISPWTYGTGNASAPAGNGPADVDVASDGTHPTYQYAAKIGVRAAEGIRRGTDLMLERLAA